MNNIEVTRAQSLRFVDRSQLAIEQTYDNRMYDELDYPVYQYIPFTQQFAVGDGSIVIQYKIPATVTPKPSVIIVDMNDNTEYALTPVLIHTTDDGYEMYRAVLTVPTILGRYYAKITDRSVTGYGNKWISEPFDVVEPSIDTVLFEWWGAPVVTDYDFLWIDGVKSILRLPANIIEHSNSIDKEVYKSSTMNVYTLNAISGRLGEITIGSIPYWMAEKVGIALTMRKIWVNKILTNTEGGIDITRLGQTILYKATVQFSEILT